MAKNTKKKKWGEYKRYYFPDSCFYGAVPRFVNMKMMRKWIVGLIGESDEACAYTNEDEYFKTLEDDEIAICINETSTYAIRIYDCNK